MELKMRLHMSRIPTRFRKEPKKKYDKKALWIHHKAFLVDEEKKMDDTTIQKVAEAFELGRKYQYDMVFGRLQKEISISFSLRQCDFTHTVGLDHLNDIQLQVSHDRKEKARLHRRILTKGNP